MTDHVASQEGGPLTPYECLSVVSDVADAAVSNLDELRKAVTGVKLYRIVPSVHRIFGGDRRLLHCTRL